MVDSPMVRRDVVCVIDHLHRDLATADDACRGVFTHCGTKLELGRRPDWIDGGLPDDEEWRIEWVKGYEGLDLAHAYAVTGDHDHLATWIDLVDSFIDQVPVGHDSSDVSARRIQNWIYSLQRFSAVTAVDHAFVARMVSRLADDIAHLREHLTAERNHRTLELYALFVAALALPGVDRTGDLVEFALDELDTNARTDLWADGTHRECSTDYHHIVLRSFVGTVVNARAAGLTLSSAFVRRVVLACEWAMHVQRPDGTIPSFSDGDNGDFRAVLELAAETFARPDFRWVATLGASGRPPARNHVTFPVGGYVVQRSGWGVDRAFTDERFALFDCGPLGDGGHGHYDQLHVELVAGRHVLAVDPGRFTYADTPMRHWFKGTIGHNTVMVDGLDQTPYRRGKPKGPVSTARLLGRWSGDDLDLVEAMVESPCYDAVHHRRLALCGGEYWVVHDVVTAATSHRYELRWHLPAEALDRVTLRRGDGVVTAVTPFASYTIVGADAVEIEAGWVSEEYGHKVDAPVLVARVEGIDIELVSVVAPGPAPDEIEVVRGDGACAVRATWGSSVEDRLVWPRDSAAASWRRSDDGAGTLQSTSEGR